MSADVNFQIQNLYNSTYQAVHQLPNQIQNISIGDIFTTFASNLAVADILNKQIQFLSEMGAPLPDPEKAEMLNRALYVNSFVTAFLTLDNLHSDEDAFQVSEEAKSFLLTYLENRIIHNQILSEKERSEVKRVIFSNQSEIVSKAAKDNVCNFAYEAQMLARLDHPNIIKLYSVFRLQNRIIELYFEPAMVDLLTIMNDEGEWMGESQKFLFQTLLALYYLSERGIIHGDIKPENLLINREGNIKVADFGSSSRVGEEIDNICTVSYRPPEVRNEESPYSPKVDIWSLAVTFFEWMKDKKTHAHPSKTMWTQDIKPYLREEMAPKTVYQGENLTQEVGTSLLKIPEARRQAFDPIQRICALIERAMVWSPQERPSAEDLLNEFFRD